MAKTCCVLALVLAVGPLAGCRDESSWETVEFPEPVNGSSGTGFNALFAGKVQRSSAKVAPISGGTLLVTKDGHAVAADPDRDQVYVVDLDERSVVTLPLEEGDEPGRVVAGADGIAYVVARRGGAVIEIDIAAGTATRIPVCAAPRGAAYDAAADSVLVACRSGLLASVDAGSRKVTRRVQLEPDLRDVVVADDQVVVSRFKSAEVLVVGSDGAIARRSQPKLANSPAFSPGVAYRTLQAPGGGVLVGHVDASNTQLPSGVGSYYGAPCGGSVADLAISVMDTAGGSAEGEARVATSFSQPIGGMSGPLDLAVSRDGTRVAILAAGNSWSPDGQQRPNLLVTSASSLKPAAGISSNCSTTNPAAVNVQGEPVAVAFDELNAWVVQSRQPAQLQLQSGSIISLASDDRSDTGLAMFYMNAGGGVACQSCHPEAGEDGHTWNFTIGPRRSQALQGGVSQRAPFHWSGDLADFDALFDEVMVKRMSLRAEVTTNQRLALRDWLDTVPREATADDVDAEAAERGRALFDDSELACGTCHSGSDYTDNVAHDVGTGAAFITPSLVGVGMRAPLFHDGCAVSLDARFGPCGGGDAHGVTSKLTPEERSDLVAFMKTL